MRAGPRADDIGGEIPRMSRIAGAATAGDDLHKHERRPCLEARVQEMARGGDDARAFAIGQQRLGQLGVRGLLLRVGAQPDHAFENQIVRRLPAVAVGRHQAFRFEHGERIDDLRHARLFHGAMDHAQRQRRARERQCEQHAPLAHRTAEQPVIERRRHHDVGTGLRPIGRRPCAALAGQPALLHRQRQALDDMLRDASGTLGQSLDEPPRARIVGPGATAANGRHGGCQVERQQRQAHLVRVRQEIRRDPARRRHHQQRETDGARDHRGQQLA